MTARADLNAMQEDWEEDQTERGAGISFWRPQTGKSYVRILPPRDDADGRAIVKGGVHWVNGRSISCPIAFRVADDCWMCERVQELHDSGNEADQKEASEIGTTVRFYANIVLPGDEDPQPKVWEFGRTVYDQIMRYMADPDYGDVTDSEEGYDMIVEREGTGFKTRYHVRARKSPSKLIKSVADLIDEDSDALQDLRNLRAFLSDEEMQEAYEGDSGAYTDKLPDDEEEEPAPRRTVKRPSKPRPAKEPEPEEEEEEEDEEPAPKARPGRPIGGRTARKAVDEALSRRKGRR